MKKLLIALVLCITIFSLTFMMTACRNYDNLSNEEKYKIYQKNHKRGWQVKEFVEHENLDTDLVEIITTGESLIANISGFSSPKAPKDFILDNDGIYYGNIHTEDVNGNVITQTLTFDETYAIYKEYFDENFISPLFNSAFYEWEDEDGKKHKTIGDRGSNLMYHNHYFELLSNTEDEIIISCVALYDLVDFESQKVTYIHYDYGTQKWISDFILNYSSTSEEYDFSLEGEEYIPNHSNEYSGNIIEKYNLRLKKIDNKWKFADFTIWY